MSYFFCFSFCLAHGSDYSSGNHYKLRLSKSHLRCDTASAIAGEAVVPAIEQTAAAPRARVAALPQIRAQCPKAPRTAAETPSYCGFPDLSGEASAKMAGESDHTRSSSSPPASSGSKLFVSLHAAMAQAICLLPDDVYLLQRSTGNC